MVMINILKAELLLFKGEIKSYSFNFLFYNLGIIIIFLGLFYSNSSIESIDAIILLYGLISWQLCNSALSYISGVIEEEAMMGTLEQVFMTRTRGEQVFIIKIFVNSGFNFIKAIVIFAFCSVIYGIWNQFYIIGFNNIIIIVLLAITVFTFGMVGLFFGGLSLFKKRIQSFLFMFSYLLLFFSNITSPIENLPNSIRIISYLIPLTWLQKIIGSIIHGNINEGALVVFLILCAVYSIAGILFFKKFLEVAKKSGKLGQY